MNKQKHRTENKTLKISDKTVAFNGFPLVGFRRSYHCWLSLVLPGTMLMQLGGSFSPLYRKVGAPAP
jgi:hypothetical protein